MTPVLRSGSERNRDRVHSSQALDKFQNYSFSAAHGLQSTNFSREVRACLRVDLKSHDDAAYLQVLMKIIRLRFNDDLVAQL